MANRGSRRKKKANPQLSGKGSDLRKLLSRPLSRKALAGRWTLLLAAAPGFLSPMMGAVLSTVTVGFVAAELIWRAKASRRLSPFVRSGLTSVPLLLALWGGRHAVEVALRVPPSAEMIASAISSRIDDKNQDSVAAIRNGSLGPSLPTVVLPNVGLLQPPSLAVSKVAVESRGFSLGTGAEAVRTSFSVLATAGQVLPVPTYASSNQSLLLPGSTSDLVFPSAGDRFGSLTSFKSDNAIAGLSGSSRDVTFPSLVGFKSSALGRGNDLLNVGGYPVAGNYGIGSSSVESILAGLKSTSTGIDWSTVGVANPSFSVVDGVVKIGQQSPTWTEMMKSLEQSSCLGKKATPQVQTAGVVITPDSYRGLVSIDSSRGCGH